MNKELFEKLADLRVAEREIKAKIEEILPEINASVEDLDSGTIIESPSGTFTVTKRRTWTYSEGLEKLEEQVKKEKKLEEQKGIATYVEKPTVIFKSVELS